MLLRACVLPSNAPPLQDSSDGLHQASQVLQEHSGNRQQQHLDFGLAGDWDQTKYLYDQKYPAGILTGENEYATRHHAPHHAQPHLYRHQPPQHRRAWRYPPYGQPPFFDEAKIQYDAERLYSRFRESDQYMKYRARQAKDDKGNGDQKWPDHLERAFFRALITYPPMGRRKQLHKEKQRGRNELIADCIEELTGEGRTRKQVSSHIQVLKPFVEHDSAIMKWLSKDDMQAKMSRYHGHSYPTGRRMSNYPVTAPPHSMHSAMPSLPRTDAYSVQQLKQSPQAFEPADFQMFIQRKYNQGGKEEMIDRLHTYSQAVTHPLAEDHPMADWQTLARDFPQLAEANTPQRPLDCTVLIAEASLAFPTEAMEKWKNRENATIELGIYFQCRSRQLPAPVPGMKSTISLVNRFYDNGQEQRQFSESTEVYFHNVQDTTDVETEIKFGSKFWASTLGRVGKELRDPLELTQQQRDHLSDQIRSLSALQEVFIASERGRERIMVIHWNFRLSNNTCGSASWKRLLLPKSWSTTGIYIAPPQQSQQQQAKIERADSFYDYSTGLPDFGAAPSSQQEPQHSLPALQSPFEYDNSSSSASALSSATTWLTSISDTNHNNNAGISDFGSGPGDTSFDFNTIPYDTTLTFEHFDSSAFNFDDTTGVDVGVVVDFAADPALQDFSQGTWYDPRFDAGAAGGQQGLGISAVDHGGSFASQTDLVDGESQELYGGAFDAGQYGGQTFGAVAAPHDQQQAFGGANGPEMIREEDALAALADASSGARALGGTK